MATEKNITVSQALQICKEVGQLYKDGIIKPDWNQFGDSYYFSKNNTELYTQRIDKYYSSTEYVPTNFWTDLIGTAGNHATVHTHWVADIHNTGVLLSVPVSKETERFYYSGLPALIIYIKMRRLYNKHKKATRQR